MREVVEWSLRPVRDDRPRHLLGIGDVDDILRAVAAGIDTFDCATPTRLAATAPRSCRDPETRWRLDLTKPDQRDSREPIDRGCPCPACREHTRGYLHYLVRAGELTAKRLITLHNLTFMQHADGGDPRGDRGWRARELQPRGAGRGRAGCGAIDHTPLG